MKVAEFLNTVKCVLREKTLVCISEEMIILGIANLRDFFAENYYRRFDDRTVSIIAPSVKDGTIMSILISIKPENA